MKQLPTTTSHFKRIITEGFLYVDKTKHIYDFIDYDSYFFLAQPRRFGKSLLISTLEELFAGNRDLFKGLWIDSSDYTWPKHPVISLDLSSFGSCHPEELNEALARKLNYVAENFGINVSSHLHPGDKLEMLIRKLSVINTVVVLIDEYNYPVVSNIEDLRVANKNLKLLDNFFAVLRSLQSYIHAIFVTGVTKLEFSSLNFLKDISLDPIAANLLGFTEQEIDTYYSPYIEQLALKKNMPIDKVRDKMHLWYKSYRFTKKPEKVYNPFSVNFLFKKNSFKDYWFDSGDPSFLVKELAKKNYTLKNIEPVKLTCRALGAITLNDFPLINLLFQTGYLTISDYDEKTENYTLTFPNSEIKESFMFYLFSAFSHIDIGLTEMLIFSANDALQNYDMESFCTLLDRRFAHTPYLLHANKEGYFHSIFQLLTTLLGFNSQSEVVTNKGIIDLVIETEDFVYIFELTYNSTPEKALKQIEERKYYERYLISGKKIVLVGIAFNQKDEKLTLNCVHKAL